MLLEVINLRAKTLPSFEKSMILFDRFQIAVLTMKQHKNPHIPSYFTVEQIGLACFDLVQRLIEVFYVPECDIASMLKIQEQSYKKIKHRVY